MQKGSPCSGGTAPGYNVDARGFAPHTSRPFLGPPSPHRYRSSMIGNLATAVTGTNPPTPSSR